MSDDNTTEIEEREVVLRDSELIPVGREVAPMIAAEINQQIATARQYPRRRDREISDEIISRSTLNEEIASECQYLKPVGGQKVPGPSIRFAEIVRASYGNIRVAARFVRIDLDDPQRAAVIVEALAMDLQTNGAEVVQVRRSIMTSSRGNKKPQIYPADLINQTVMAGQSIARRNAILVVVPKAIWIEGYQRAVRVIQGDANTLAGRREQVVAAFERVGVEAERLFASIGVKSIDDITVEHMPMLVGMMTAIKDGEHPNEVVGRQTMEFERVENPLGSGGEGQRHEPDKPEVRTDPAKPQPPEAKREAAKPAPAEVPRAQEQERPKPQQAAAADAAAEREKPTGATEPSDDASYREYAAGWIRQTNSITQIDQRWKKEKELRARCRVTPATLEHLDDVKSAQIDQIRKQ